MHLLFIPCHVRLLLGIKWCPDGHFEFLLFLLLAPPVLLTLNWHLCECKCSLEPLQTSQNEAFLFSAYGCWVDTSCMVSCILYCPLRCHVIIFIFVMLVTNYRNFSPGSPLEQKKIIVAVEVT